MNDFEAEFKQMMADTQQEVNAEVYQSRAEYLMDLSPQSTAPSLPTNSLPCSALYDVAGAEVSP